jgi:hypothetical protein
MVLPRAIGRSLLLILPVLFTLGLPVAAQVPPQTQILGGAKERQPGYGEIENFTIVSYSDLDGWDQAAELRVSRDGKFAYTANYKGASIVDISDAEKPRVVSRVTNHPSVQSQYIDVLGNVLVVNQEAVREPAPTTWEPGIRLHDNRPEWKLANGILSPMRELGEEFRAPVEKRGLCSVREKKRRLSTRKHAGPVSEESSLSIELRDSFLD